MKLTEALEPLFESFSQLRTFIQREEEEGNLFTTGLGQDLKSLMPSLMRSIEQYDPTIPKGDLRHRHINDLFRWAMQHPNLPEKHKEKAQTGRVIRIIRQEGMDRALFFLYDLMRDLKTAIAKPEKQAPRISRVSAGNGWESFQLHNYAAAREVCNRYGATFCIGSSNTTWFDEYGEDMDRDTFAIVINNSKVVIVHSGPRSFLITSSDNRHDVSSLNLPRINSNNLPSIINDFGNVDMAREAISSVMSDSNMEEFEDMMSSLDSYKRKIGSLDGALNVSEFKKQEQVGFFIESEIAKETIKVYEDVSTGRHEIQYNNEPSASLTSERFIEYTKKLVSYHLDSFSDDPFEDPSEEEIRYAMIIVADIITSNSTDPDADDVVAFVQFVESRI